MNTRGLISSRSDVIALLSGELLEYRTETSFIFQTNYFWDPHYYLLTSIGVFKFKNADMESKPSFVPLARITEAALVDDERTRYTPQKIMKLVY